ncbi:MAG TPA: hypothetical protein VFT72_06150 [Opitutaceae bacterium]|nr:hypothetical protein [Opitutaceae bacterium]
MKLLTLFVLTAGVASAQLTTLSTRLNLDQGEHVTISFTIPDGASQRVYLRAAGPMLSKFGVSGVLADPKIELYKGETLIGQNDNWTSESVDGGAQSAFPFDPNSKDAGLSINLAAGSYTMITSSSDGGWGVALPELYSVTNGSLGFSRLSIEGSTGPGFSRIIAGLIGKNDRYLIRALRPTLDTSGAIADPTLSLYNGQAQLESQNDNWETSPQADEIAKAVSAYGLTPFSAGGKDAVLLYQFSELGGPITVLAGGHDDGGKVRLEFIDLSMPPPVNAVPVPEPSSYAVAACALLALPMIGRRRKRR